MKTMRNAGLLMAYLLMVAVSPRATAAVPCAATGEEAVRLFVERYAAQAPDSVDLLLPTSLAEYRGALAQMLDDRYAPDSAAWRVQVLGTDWTPARVSAATDAELLKAYLAHGASARPAVSVTDIRVGTSDDKWHEFYPLDATYGIEVDGKKVQRSGQFKAEVIAGCWKVSLPVQAWVRLHTISERLKTSRPNDPPVSSTGVRMSLQILAASTSPVPGAKRLDGWAEPIWIDGGPPLASERDLVGASAWWSCPGTGGAGGAQEPALHLTLDGEAAKRISRFSRRAVFPKIAVIADGKVIAVPYVRGEPGSSVELCGHFDLLEDAQAMAASLRGDSR